MDQNKLDILRHVKYEVTKSCSFCVYSSLTPMSGKLFGTCARFDYLHAKHTGPERKLSVSAFGTCPDFEEDTAKTTVLHGFKEFMK